MSENAVLKCALAKQNNSWLGRQGSNFSQIDREFTRYGKLWNLVILKILINFFAVAYFNYQNS